MRYTKGSEIRGTCSALCSRNKGRKKLEILMYIQDNIKVTLNRTCLRVIDLLCLE